MAPTKVVAKHPCPSGSREAMTAAAMVTKDQWPMK